MKMIMTPTKDDDCKRVIKKFDDAIRSLVDAAASQDVSRGPYSYEVYEAARNVAKGYRKWVLVRGLLKTDRHCNTRANRSGEAEGQHCRLASSSLSGRAVH